MEQYNVTSTSYGNFSLTLDGNSLAELIYPKWYSFNAEIKLADNTQLSLVPKGFWDAKVELKKGDDVLMTLKLGWKGIIINVKSAGVEESYLLKIEGLLNTRYVLVDTNEKELLAVKSDFEWSGFKFNYVIETSEEFEKLKMKEAFLLSVIHGINYQLAAMAGTM